LGGIAGEKDQDALLAATAAGDVVFLQGLLLGVGRDGVKIQIDRGAMSQTGVLDLINQACIKRRLVA